MSRQTENEARQRVVDVLVKLGIMDSARTEQVVTQLGKGYFDDIDDAWEFEGSLGGAKVGPVYFSFHRASSVTDETPSPHSLDQLRALASAACQAALPDMDFKPFAQDPQQFATGMLFVFTDESETFRAAHGWNTVAVEFDLSGNLIYFSYYDEPVW